MNHYVQKRSGLFLLTAWVFLASLSADSANLDDLFPSNFVVHDDDEVCSNASSPVSQDLSPGLPRPPNVPGKRGQLVVDQDSPALASDPLGPPSTIVSRFLLHDKVSSASFSSSDPFYLLNCTLLI
jgi:hypothetical protein